MLLDVLDRRNFLILSAAGVTAGATAACSAQSGQSAAPQNAEADVNVVDAALDVGETEIDLGGVVVRTWAYNQQVPAKEIRLRKGQTLRAPVTNNVPQETTVHWHGLAIPNQMDGVGILTQPAIAPQNSFHYEFVVPDAGTYYLHSHVGTQLDRGLYGPLIIDDPDERGDYDDELVVVLDDWIDGTGAGTTPDQVVEKLRVTGMAPMGDDPGVTPTTPLGTDGGDVSYPYYLINGRVSTDPQVVDSHAGQRLRLRIINAGGDTAFRVAVPDTQLDVTHTDGYPVVPQTTNSVILGMGERVDAIIRVGSSVPLVAAAEGKDGFAQLNIRVDGGQSAVNIDEFVKTLRAAPVLNTAQLAPAPNVLLPARSPDATLELRLAGPVNGYTWPINGKLYDPPNNGMAVQANQRVRMRFISESKMFHPMHLHGHTFQVQQANGAGARKDTVLVPPLETVEVDFDTNNPGNWIVHCHNDYHLDSGMATFLYYR